MFALSSRKIASIDVANVVANLGGKFSVDIPSDYNVARLQLRVSNGAITVGTAAATALQAGGAANLLSSIHLQSRDDARWDLNSLESSLVNRVMNQDSITQVDPLLTTGDKTFGVVITRDFVMDRMLIPTNHRGILPSRLVRDMQLQCQIADPSAILKKDTTTTLAYKAGTTIEVVIEQAVDSPSEIDFYLNEQLSSNQYPNIITQLGETEIKLDTSGKFRMLILYATKTVAGVTTFDDTLINNIKLYVSNSQAYDVPWVYLQEENQRAFNLPAKIAGVAVLDWTKNYQPTGLLPADEIAAGGQFLYIKPNCAVSSATSTFGIIMVRLWDNMRLPLIPVAAGV